jgi:translation initiation factor IF-2
VHCSARDEEIAGLQAELALRLDSGEAVERLEMELRQREELEEELAEQKRRADELQQELYNLSSHADCYGRVEELQVELEEQRWSMTLESI